jgi:transposase, IS605 orfB family protein
VDILKYTTETRLYIKNNKDIVDYFDEVKAQYNHIFRKVYHIIKNNPKLKINLLNTKLQNKYGINKRTASSIIKTVQGRINSIRELKKTEIKQKQYKLEKISEKLEKLVPILLDLKLKAKENNIEDLIKYRNFKTKVAFMKIRKDKLVNKIKSLNYQLETDRFKITFGTKKLFRKNLEEFLNKRDNQIVFIGSRDETGCNQTFQLKYVAKINQFILKIRKDFKYKNEKGEKRYVYGKCFFNSHSKFLREILKSKNFPLTYRIIKKSNKYYLQCIFEIDNKNTVLTGRNYGVIGIDFNKGFLAISQTNKYGHLVKTDKMTYRFGSGNKTKNDLLLIINKLTELAINTGKDLVIEDLNFSKAKSRAIKGKFEKGKKYNEMLHSLAYRMFSDRTEQICNRKNVGLIKVSPAWTSWIAKNKFCNKMKLNIHAGASFVIARRGMNIKDAV